MYTIINIIKINTKIVYFDINFSFPNQAINADKKIEIVIIIVIVAAVLSANTANSTDGKTPLPYWSDPKRAAAEPDISPDTVFSVAAFAHAATIPFILNTKNIGITIPNSPNECVTPIIAKITEKIKAREVDMARSRLILKCVTKRRFSILIRNTPSIFTPNNNEYTLGCMWK